MGFIGTRHSKLKLINFMLGIIHLVRLENTLHVYQRVKNVTFSGNFANVLNEPCYSLF